MVCLKHLDRILYTMGEFDIVVLRLVPGPKAFQNDTYISYGSNII